MYFSVFQRITFYKDLDSTKFNGLLSLMRSSKKAIMMFGIIVTTVISMSLKGSAQETSPTGIPVLEKIIINNDSVLLPSVSISKGGYSNTGNLVLSHRNNNISFEIVRDTYAEFQYFLEGYDKVWTMWQRTNYKEYTNLPAGYYTLHLRYRENETAISEITLISFKVLAPWYQSPLALVLYPLFVILVIWVFYNQLNYRFAKTQYMLEQIINNRTEDLVKEKEKSETLLNNVLPKGTADEIMNKGKAEKTKYNFVTVLFSDIQGFTKIAEEMNPEVLIDELDKFFFHFDSVVEKYDIEKIKTIGDAYMCAGGIPEKNRTNPVEVVLAALEMQEYMLQMKGTTDMEGVKFWDIRIGIHTGTVIAGVVGHKKMTYDIWGDTVNTASRMETSGEAGKVNISGTTYEFVKDFFNCEHRGKMPVKYKGELDMYFVEGIKPELRENDNRPNRKFFIKMQLMKLQDIEEQVFKLFDDEAPPDLYFHNSALTKSICTQVELLARAEGLLDEEYVILKLSAVFLLTGYISDYDNPLNASCENAAEMLPKYGFKENDIEETKRLITSSFTGVPASLSEMILHDSLYDYLGRVDYLKQTERLLKEKMAYGKVTDSLKWINGQKDFLISNDFYTNSAKVLRSVTNEEQIAGIDSLPKSFEKLF
jgi:adenylate cyclase